jgi:hypothetical protein
MGATPEMKIKAKQKHNTSSFYSSRHTGHTIHRFCTKEILTASAYLKVFE